MSAMHVYQALHWASSFLQKRNRETNIAYILMEYHLDVTNAVLHTKLRQHLPEEVWQAFERDLILHAETGKPVQHITGTAPFYGYTFSVNENVLIPRFETEELVHKIIEDVKKMDKNKSLTIIDVGTGSGVIAVCLALALPNVTVYATDISEAALIIAKENAKRLGANVQFLHGSFLEPVIEAEVKADIIVSNPPYINRADEELLHDTVKEYDPHLALFADREGLAAYEDITWQMQSIPTVKQVYFEIGFDQGLAVQRILQKQYHKSEPFILQDINGKDRIVIAYL